MSTMAKTQATDERKQQMTDDYKTLMQVGWNFDYESGIEKLKDLYTRAKNNQWKADDLKWDTPIDPSGPITQRENSQYFKMPFFQRLSRSQQETFIAHSTAQMLSQFLHGEQGALMTAATITHGIGDMQGKFYAASQTFDEARHVEVYDRYVNKIAIAYPMVAWLKELIDVTLKTEDINKVLIGMNMVIEGLALGAFHNMYQQTGEPLLKALTFNVMRDESRHVSFGHVFLAPKVAAMHVDDREDLAQFAFEAVKILIDGQQEMDPGFLNVLEASNIDPQDFMAGMKEAAEQGIVQDLPPGQVHPLEELMLPALVRAGLITQRARELYKSAGLEVSDDLTTLHAMEDAKSDLNVLNKPGVSY